MLTLRTCGIMKMVRKSMLSTGQSRAIGEVKGRVNLFAFLRDCITRTYVVEPEPHMKLFLDFFFIHPLCTGMLAKSLGARLPRNHQTSQEILAGTHKL